MERHRTLWTDEEILQLGALLAAGLSMREAARELGRTEEAAHTQALKAGFQKKRGRA